MTRFYRHDSVMSTRLLRQWQYSSGYLSGRILQVTITWDWPACRIHPWKRSSLSCFQERLKPSLSSVSHWSEGLPFAWFSLSGQILFDTHCPFGLRSSAMICAEQGFLADVYLDDFYSAEYPSLAASAFFSTKPVDKDSPPLTSMNCLGILVDTVAFTLEVPATHLTDLQAELTTWQVASFFTKKQLQSLLGKLSFITVCVKPGRIFMPWLLNSLRECTQPAGQHYPISATMPLDIQWWLTFLPQFHRVSLIKPSFWDFESFNFSTDACLHGGGATCRRECISFVSPDCTSPSS